MLVLALAWIYISSTIDMFPVDILFTLIGVVFIAAVVRDIYLAVRPGGREEAPESKGDEAPQPHARCCPCCGMPVEKGQSFCFTCGRRL